MSASYSDIVLWAIFLFLSYIGYWTAVVWLLNRAEFNDLERAAQAATGRNFTLSVLYYKCSRIT